MGDQPGFNRDMHRPELPIHDLYVEAIQTEQSATGSQGTIYDRSNHLLRRFGQVSFLTLEPSGRGELSGNDIADEVWALLSGEVVFEWFDERVDSPSRGASYQAHLTTPGLVLVPFGVRFSFEVGQAPTTLLRISSEEASSDACPMVVLSQEGEC
jgi:hypothetical protein